MDDIIESLVLSVEQIKEISINIANYINKEYANKKPIFISLLKGALPFTKGILEYINIDYDIEYIRASSYVGVKSTGTLKVGNIPDVRNRDIIIFDDIIDSGNTLSKMTKLLLDNGASSVISCVLLDKYQKRTVDFNATIVGKKIEDGFVVGYGLDYNEQYRELPYVGILKEEVYK